MQRVQWITVLVRSGCTEKVCLRPRRHHQKITLVLLPVDGFHRAHVEIDGDDFRHLYVYVGVAPECGAQIESYIVWSEDRGGHLVEQRLELLIVVLAEQSDPNIWVRSQLASAVQSGEAATYDHDVLHVVRILSDGRAHGWGSSKARTTSIGNAIYLAPL